MRQEVIRVSESNVVRMAMIINHDLRRPEETWKEWHVRSWRSVNASIQRVPGGERRLGGLPVGMPLRKLVARFDKYGLKTWPP